MQNKGAIRLFAILLALACAYYLMFTYVANGIEKDAKAFAVNCTEQVDVKEAAKKSLTGEKNYLDSVSTSKLNYYLDSLKKKTVYSLFIADYTYDEVKKRQLNLGLDLKGGMNVTLEVGLDGLIRSMSNNPKDVTLNKALASAIELKRNSDADFVTLFGQAYNTASLNGRLAPLFAGGKNKGIPLDPMMCAARICVS